MKMKEKSEKAGLKSKIHKTKIMTPGLITSWEKDGETMETEPDYISLCSKITADGDCSHEINCQNAKHKVLFYFYFLAMLHGLWDPSFPSRDQTWALGSESTLF